MTLNKNLTIENNSNTTKCKRKRINLSHEEILIKRRKCYKDIPEFIKKVKLEKRRKNYKDKSVDEKILISQKKKINYQTLIKQKKSKIIEQSKLKVKSKCSRSEKILKKRRQNYKKIPESIKKSNLANRRDSYQNMSNEKKKLLLHERKDDYKKLRQEKLKSNNSKNNENKTLYEIYNEKNSQKRTNSKYLRTARIANLDFDDNSITINSIGDMNIQCKYCAAYHFKGEVDDEKKFKNCCHKGIITLTSDPPYPIELIKLYNED